MSTFDDYNVLMNDLCLDLKQVTRGIVTLRTQITSENNKLDNVREQAAEEIQSLLDDFNHPLSSHLMERRFRTRIPRRVKYRCWLLFRNSKKIWKKSNQCSVLKKVEAMIKEQENLSKKCVVIERKVRTLCADIDRWLTSTMKKPRLPLRHRGLRGKST